MANGSFGSSTSEYLNLRVDWSSVANVPNNSSDVTMNVYLEHWNIDCSARDNATMVCNGETYTYSTSAIDENVEDGETLLGTHTFTVAHDSDGTKSVILKATWYFGGDYSGERINTMTATSTVDLDNISQQSTISSITQNVEVDGTNAVNISISRANSSFTHVVNITLDNTYSYARSNVGESFSYAVPKIWLNGLPSSTSATVTATVTTYNGSNIVGQTIEETFTISVPSSVVPTFDLTATMINNEVPSNWEIYVANKSQCKVEIENATGAYSSTITDYSIVSADYTSSSQLLTTPALKAGSITFTGTITDSRGRTATDTLTILVHEYSLPIVSEFWVKRCLADGTLNKKGTNMKTSFSVSYSSCDNNNSTIRKMVYRKLGTQTWSSVIDFSDDDTIVTGSNGIEVNKSYEIKYVVSDEFEDCTFYTELQAGFSMFEWLATGLGIGIGIIPTLSGWLDVGFKAIFRDEVLFKDVAKQQGYPILGYRGEIDKSFNQLKSGGIYFYNHDGSPQSSRPFDENAVVEVIESPFSSTQRATSLVTNKMKYRSFYENSWNDWAQSGGSEVITEDMYTFTGFNNPNTQELNIEYSQSGVAVVIESEE